MVTRRELFKTLIRRSSEFTMQTAVELIDRRLPARTRPPGGVAEPLFLASCSRCMDCARACPHHAIFSVSEGYDASTPLMVLEQRGCHLCEDFPCIRACGEGVLEIPESGEWYFGRVAIQPDLCITFKGPECGACGGLCPGEQAIQFRTTKPVMIESLCSGCGLCMQACPTSAIAFQD